MTFSEILSAVYEETAYQASPAAAVTTRIKRLVNEGVRAIVGELQDGADRRRDEARRLRALASARLASAERRIARERATMRAMACVYGVAIMAWLLWESFS